MPFLPFVLLLAWQALSRGASFALGWATAMYFGQVPGKQGSILSVISLLSAAWVVLLIGFALPLLAGAALEATGIIEDNFDVETIHYMALAAALVLTPLVVAGCVVWAKLHDERSVGQWLRLIPVSYPGSFMLGISVLQMVAFTPVLLFQRWRKKRKLVEIAVMLREGADDKDMLEAIQTALSSIGVQEARVTEASGPKSWPLHTLGFVARHLLGAVVRGEPLRIDAGELEIQAYATNVSILGPKEEAYRARAAIERVLAFSEAYLTWNEESQVFEDELLEIHRDADGDVSAVRRRLDKVQERIDVASLNSQEWNVLYRRMLQVEQDVARRAEKPRKG